jgi:hypothetical protein
LSLVRFIVAFARIDPDILVQPRDTFVKLSFCRSVMPSLSGEMVKIIIYSDPKLGDGIMAVRGK